MYLVPLVQICMCFAAVKSVDAVHEFVVLSSQLLNTPGIKPSTLSSAYFDAVKRLLQLRLQFAVCGFDLKTFCLPTRSATSLPVHLSPERFDAPSPGSL